MDGCHLYITCMTELTLSFVKNACTEGEQAQRHAARAGPTLLEGPMAGLAKPLADRGICPALPTGHRIQKEPAEFSSLQGSPCRHVANWRIVLGARLAMASP
jgi:hypothetical protein